jgi:transcriptional regulator with XRE-family HTH domain
MDASARQRLRDARSAAGFSLRELARRVGVSASLLSQIENGRTDPSVSTLYALVSELDLSLDELLSGGATGGQEPRRRLAHTTPVLRPGTRAVLEMDSGVRWERLTGHSNEHVDALLVTYEPGGSSSSTGKLMAHAGVEYAYLFEGQLTLQLAFDEHVIEAGDSLEFDSTTPHLYVNRGAVPAYGIWFVLGRGLASAEQHVGNLLQQREGRLSSAADVLEAFQKVDQLPSPDRLQNDDKAATI